MPRNDNSIIIDTGCFLALASPSDTHHKKAIKLLKQTEEQEWITTWPVVIETCHLLGRLSALEVNHFLDLYYQDAFSIFELTKEHVSRLQDLMIKYAELPMDLADASLVVLAEFLGHGKILSTDSRDFCTYKWKNRHPFQNLFY
ncbi:MAG: PIN domain-containing protein [Parachlamydia sp.]|nr:PIN domain-containing protein [Parachlamydia sp.]